MADQKESAVPPVEETGMSAHLAGPFNLKPQNLTEAMDYAKLMAKSELVPKEYIGKPANILIAVQLGNEVGLSPLQSLMSIAVINGRPTMWGDGLLAIVKNSGVLDETFGEGGIVERPPNEALAASEGSFTIKRKDMANPMTRTFSLAEAETAGLVRRSGPSGPWNTYRGRMLQMRARGWGLRDSCADVLKGLRSREEERDQALQEAEYRVIPPARKSESGQTAEVDKFLEGAKPTTPGAPRRASANPASTSGASKSQGYESWTGKILNVVGPKSGTTNGKKWIIWPVECEGDFKVTIFHSEEMANIAYGLKNSGKPAVIEYEVSKKGNIAHTIDAAPTTTAPADDGPTPGDQD